MLFFFKLNLKYHCLLKNSIQIKRIVVILPHTEIFLTKRKAWNICCFNWKICRIFVRYYVESSPEKLKTQVDCWSWKNGARSAWGVGGFKTVGPRWLTSDKRTHPPKNEDNPLNLSLCTPTIGVAAVQTGSVFPPPEPLASIPPATEARTLPPSLSPPTDRYKMLKTSWQSAHNLSFGQRVGVCRACVRISVRQRPAGDDVVKPLAERLRYDRARRKFVLVFSKRPWNNINALSADRYFTTAGRRSIDRSPVTRLFSSIRRDARRSRK